MPRANSTSNRALLMTIVVMLSLIILGGTFVIGMKVGEFRSSSHAFKRFRQAGFPPDVIREMRPDRYRSGRQRHGFGGEVLSIGSGTLVLLRRDGTERTIAFGSDTKVENRGEQGTVDDITIGSEVIAIGKPDEDDTIHARVLILPPWGG
jgi:hypothetical protein